MRRTGFTLVELLCVLTVAGILLAVAAPAFHTLRARSAQEAARDELLGALNLARHTAVMRQVDTSLCGRAPGTALRCGASADGWRHGWIAFTDPNADENCTDTDGNAECDGDGGEILRVGRAATRPVTIRGNHFIRSDVGFAPAGYAPWNQGTFSICATGAPPRYIVIAPSGRIRTGAPGASPDCP